MGALLGVSSIQMRLAPSGRCVALLLRLLFSQPRARLGFPQPAAGERASNPVYGVRASGTSEALLSNFGLKTGERVAILPGYCRADSGRSHHFYKYGRPNKRTIKNPGYLRTPVSVTGHNLLNYAIQKCANY
jgi:hypothetical protein